MKSKIILGIVIILFSFSLAGCGNRAKASGTKNVASNKQQTEDETKEDKQNQPAVNAQLNNPSETQSQTRPQTSTGEQANSNTSPAEVKKKIIVIDPGHANKANLQKEALAPGSSEMKIKDGGGAQGIVTKTPEYVVNMNVALKLKKLLEAKNFTVVMTKTDNSLSLGNIERAQIWNNANANLVLRIHADSNNNSSIMGASMLYPSPINDNTKKIYSESKRCGGIILNTLVKEVGMPDRGLVQRNDMTGFNWSKVPVVLVEMGFLSNSKEDKLLSSDDYENKLAQALADGITAAEN